MKMIKMIRRFTTPIRNDATKGIALMASINADRVFAVSYADKAGKYQDQSGLTLPRVD